MAIKLKPCPFCGGRVKIRYKQPFNWIECKLCEVSMVRVDSYGQRDREKDLVDTWNRRATDG